MGGLWCAAVVFAVAGLIRSIGNRCKTGTFGPVVA